MAVVVGARLGPYQIVAPLGAGAMGEVIAFPVHRTFPAGQVALMPEPASDSVALPTPRRLSMHVGRRLAATSSGDTAPHREPLWREVTGTVLRAERQRQHRTLANVAGRAGMSIQYLSELERGRKEASSEMLSAACGALGLGLADFAERCARTITALTSTAVTARPSGPVLLAA